MDHDGIPFGWLLFRVLLEDVGHDTYVLVIETHAITEGKEDTSTNQRTVRDAWKKKKRKGIRM